jgi:hypothetical protein
MGRASAFGKASAVFPQVAGRWREKESRNGFGLAANAGKESFATDSHRSTQMEAPWFRIRGGRNGRGMVVRGIGALSLLHLKKRLANLHWIGYEYPGFGMGLPVRRLATGTTRWPFVFLRKDFNP